MEAEKGWFFSIGVAVPSGDGKEILTLLAQELGKLPNKVSIEGHTDAKPFPSYGNYGNRELSPDRANSARRVMQQAGLGSQGHASPRLRRPAFAQTRPSRRYLQPPHLTHRQLLSGIQRARGIGPQVSSLTR